MKPFTIDPGEMRTWVTFQAPTESTDASGAQSDTYANVGSNPTVRARRVDSHGSEAVASDAYKSVQQTALVIRYRTDILTPGPRTDWRVLINGEPWQILSIDHIREQRRWIEIIAERARGSK